MKIKIIFDIKDKPTGGGNQFLKALKLFFIENEVYTDSDKEANVFLFNSYQFIPDVLNLKIKYPEKIFIHRIDGPIRLYSKMSDKRDKIINITNEYIADATVFQSEWSKKMNYDLGLQKKKYETTIINAPDLNIFNRNDKLKFSTERKIKIVATSWSAGVKKGFDVYENLDEILDFNKYEMTFCGNSPIEFKNIKHIKPLPSNELAEQLKWHDIFITASQKDPCSNSLIEALHCGLPAIALNDGGHPEIIKDAGLFFEKPEEIPDLIKKIIENYSDYQSKISLPKINAVAANYLSFIEEIYNKPITMNELKKSEIRKIKFSLLRHKIYSKFGF